jgi:hypothetical protein
MHTNLEQRRAAVGQRLRALPDEMAQPYDWAEFQRRARVRGASSDASRSRRNAAIAAGVVALIVVIAVWSRFGRSHDAPDATVVAEGDSASWSSTDSHSTAAISSSQDGDFALRFGSGDPHAAAVEKWLATLPREPVIVRVGTRAVVAGLEDRIAQLDDLLSAEGVEGAQPARLVVLQQQRARLVSSLAQVRYAESLAAETR